MRYKMLFLLAALCFFFQAGAQEETLFGDIDENDIGAFGSPILEIGPINDQTSGYVGGGGALVIRGFFLGGYGIGTSFADTEIAGTRYEIKFNHGGLWLGYAPVQYKVVHPYTSLRIGWGKSQLRRGDEADFSERNFVLTPELGLEVNAFDFLKIAFTGGYRWVNGVDNLPTLNNNDFSNFMGTITFRIGGFGGYDDWDW